MRRWLTILGTPLLVLLLAWLGYRALRPALLQQPDSVGVRVQLRGAADQVQLVRQSDGTYVYLISSYDSPTKRFTPEQFTRSLYEQQVRPQGAFTFLNITGPLGLLWVGIGLAGQGLFTLRMILQWMISEKQHKSVVPPVFWWLSLGGSLMLGSYFVWRWDMVALLGQSLGFVVYVRNIYLIYSANSTGGSEGQNTSPYN